MFSPVSTISTPSSPGLQALKAAGKIKDISVFKKPVGCAKKRKIKILSEDVYIDKMGEIIQRDFFPHLEKLKAQNEYLDALEKQDTKKMRELFEKYSFERPNTERMPSPATFETPERKENEMDTPSSTSSQLVNESKKSNDLDEIKAGLDAFLSSHTSEDNASFEEILEENEIKHKIKHAWLYQEENSSINRSIKNNDNQLSITSGNKRPFELDMWKFKDKNYIMYIPDGVELTTEEKIELAKKKQQVKHINTRLTVNPFNEEQNREVISEIAKTQSKANDGKIGVDGKEIVRTNTPRINGFSLIATPSPAPGECDSPIMTWGQIEGTPFRLDGGDTPLIHKSQGPAFRMSEPAKREKIALQLAEKAGERNRDKKLKALNAARRSLATPSPRSAIDRLNTMSPAARRLATQKLRVSVSPSPQRSNLMKTPNSRTSGTPRIHSPLVKTPKTPVLTDNLLNLPQRQRASDFFY